MLCPIFKKVTEDWCLRDNCKWYDRDEEVCTYDTYMKIKTSGETEEGRKRHDKTMSSQ